jgi:hypothetical protein
MQSASPNFDLVRFAEWARKQSTLTTAQKTKILEPLPATARGPTQPASGD